MPKTTMDIVEAAKYSGFSPAYIRYLVREHKLSSALVPIGEGLSVSKHIISKADLDAFLSEKRPHTRRPDHRNKYSIYATPKELDRLMALLKKSGMEDVAASIKPANAIKGFPNGSAHNTNQEEEAEE